MKKPFTFIYKIGNAERVVVDLTGTTVRPEEVMGVSTLRPTDYILRDPVMTPVTSVDREYLKSRGWIYISAFAPGNIYEVAEIERISKHQAKRVQEIIEEKKKAAQICKTADFSYLY